MARSITVTAFWQFLILVSLLFRTSHALYFYLDGTVEKCFYEELPKDTLVVGKLKPFRFTLQSALQYKC